MPPTADVEASPSEQPPSTSHRSDQHLPAPTMPENHLDNSTTATKDDPATVAASEELKHTTISDKVVPQVQEVQAEDAAQSEPAGEDREMVEPVKEHTPEADPADALDEKMRDRISSPKKKRGRDQDDDTKESDEANVAEPGSSADPSVLNGSRTTRSAPEKKRPRDTSEEYPKAAEEVVDAKTMAASNAADVSTENETTKKSTDSSQKLIFGSGFGDKSQTSTSAFASSGFASLASSSTSPFGSLGATKPSVFGGNTQPAASPFGSLAAAKPPTTQVTPSSTESSATKPPLGFGSASGFGSLGSGNGSVFGSRSGNGFAGGSGPKLSSFAAPGVETIASSKPAKAFGAPESDDEGSDEGDSEGGAADDDEESVAADDKKKSSKITKVHVEDGESGEATLLQMRAKLFAIESKETGWKERGVGTLKVNVPKACASFDENGVAIPGSFDASGLEDEEEDYAGPRVPRLIMRQENTHRVVLNTIIVRAMEFKDKPSASSAQILFTAFEGEKPINMLLKMSEANARLFRSEIDSIQHEL